MTKTPATTIRPAYKARLEFTLPPSRYCLLPANEPLPKTIVDFVDEVRCLIEATEAIEDTIAGRIGDPSFHLQVLGLEVQRLKKCSTEFIQRIPDYPSAPEFEGKTERTYCEIAMKIGEHYWTWIHSARPVRQSGKTLVNVLSQETLGDWEYAKQMATFVAGELPQIKQQWRDAITKPERLLSLLMIECKRVPPDGKAKAPNGTPGRKRDPKNQARADMANEMRSMTPQASWKEVANAINDDQKLKSDEKPYKASSIRSLHKLFYPPEKNQE